MKNFANNFLNINSNSVNYTRYLLELFSKMSDLFEKSCNCYILYI